MPFQLTISGLSDIGRVRRRNEDSLELDPVLGIAVVADGMGGHPGGDVASQVAAAHAVARLRESRAPTALSGTPEGAMSEALLGAHGAIRARVAREPSLDGMGTTLTALAMDPDRGSWVLGHVGDSRAYLLREGSLRRLTRDDTWVQQRVDAAELTDEQARHHPFGHILTQCLGLDRAPAPHVSSGTVQAGDVFLLCTDGLVGMVEDDVLADILRSKIADDTLPQLEAAAAALVRMANERGGQDNVTVALIAVG